MQPDLAVFGKKDYQQLAIIQQLVRDLSFDIQLIGGPIVRAEDGLALSSRNQYLTETERAAAPELHKAVQDLAVKLQSGRATSETTLQSLIESITAINAKGFKVDYLEVRNQDLTPITEFAGKQSWVIAVAAWLGKARLLDNQEVDI